MVIPVMSITGISINQDNFTNGSNLVTVHNPLSFIIDCTYTGTAPDYCLVNVKDKDAVQLGQFRCVFESDPIPTVRRFIFYADEIFRGFMGGFDDFAQGGFSLEYCEDITKQFTLDFLLTSLAVGLSIDVDAIHASQQFGRYPNLDNIYNNEPKTYEAYEDKPVYVYFYNGDETNIITITEYQVDTSATDSDDVDFTDSDGVVFNITIPA